MRYCVLKRVAAPSRTDIFADFFPNWTKTRFAIGPFVLLFLVERHFWIWVWWRTRECDNGVRKQHSEPSISSLAKPTLFGIGSIVANLSEEKIK